VTNGGEGSYYYLIETNETVISRKLVIGLAKEELSFRAINSTMLKKSRQPVLHWLAALISQYYVYST